MELVFFLAGGVLGAIITFIFYSRSKIYGVIQVDHNLECCSIHLSSDELMNRKSKQAIFDINHEANLSRKEQTL